ncbi:hypothetical protein LNU06_01625 [Campylobacter sp. VicNov18]|uniref:hypothetical protein n=1 Tax=Campylobacter bilis TaxID=2691918 RepID=UPI00187B2CAF|nr:hypothetical protein [Campylobacter bilis]MBM0636863.1 hypothetical protein [Campylobacter bilis]MCC8277569.1 hypothetical protein [Campylobacter bilis]MCC8299178.1 hypothetical protein [Campylobacter bilis]MCC8300478.1 hypothetical protein [Campylobacter bilis]MCC8349504.1 hypothetical protein [Campylobacter bilis]
MANEASYQKHFDTAQELAQLEVMQKELDQSNEAINSEFIEAFIDEVEQDEAL